MVKYSYKDPNMGQYQLEYAMYMILSSYFRKVRCTNGRVENRLKLFYAELPYVRQEDLEEACIALTENRLLKELNIPNIETKDATMKFIPKKDGNVLEYRGEDFKFRISFKKEKKKIKYSFVREDEAVVLY